MSAFPPPPPGLDLQQNQQPEIKGSIIVTWALALIVVCLRFISRRMSRAQLWLDDWLIVPPLAFATVLCFVSVVWTPEGVVPVFFQGLFISELVYTGVMVCVKFSILALYWRLFKVAHIKIAVYVVAVVVTCWGVAVLLIICLQCIPLRGFWDKTIQATCGVDDYKFFIGNSIPNILTDFALLSIPIRPVWKLQVAKSQKVTLTLMFLMGGFVTATSITRLVYLMNLDLKSPDFTWNFGVTQIWTCVELHAAIISACLPCLRPIISLFLPSFVQGFSTQRSGRNAYKPDVYALASKKSDKALLTDSNRSYTFSQLNDNDFEADAFGLAPTNPGSVSKMQKPKMNTGSSHIVVQRDINVHWNQPKRDQVV